MPLSLVPNFPGSQDTALSLLTAVNKLETQLNGALANDANGNNGQPTIIDVVSTAGFPTQGLILIDAEVISYTGITATSFTGITRAQDGTASAVHITLTAVKNGVIALYHNILALAIIAAQGELLTGWLSISEALTYDNADDDPTYRMTAATDVTSKYSVGMKIKLTNATVKYFIITAIDYNITNAGKTTFFLYGGTDYNLVNAAITSPYYSTRKAPYGFPMNTEKWILEVSNTGNAGQVAAQNVWYNVGSDIINVPIGNWKLHYLVCGECDGATIQVTLSTANNSQSDVDFTVHCQSQATWLINYTREKYLSVTVKTPYYLNLRTTSGGNPMLNTYGSYSKTIIRAVCAYL